MKAEGRKFGNSLMGYNKKAVDEYIAVLESEIEIVNKQMEKREKEIKELRASVDKMQNQTDANRSESENLLDDNKALRARIEELEGQLWEQRDEMTRSSEMMRKAEQANAEHAEFAERAEREREELLERVRRAERKNAALLERAEHAEQEREEMAERAKRERAEQERKAKEAKESMDDPQTIRDAILSAQRMSNIIVSEAKEKAETIRREVEDERAKVQLDIQHQLDAANTETDQMIAAAERKCSDLQLHYDKILLDVSGFKSEMIDLYRKHLELLYKLPDNGKIALPEVDPVPVTDTENDDE